MKKTSLFICFFLLIFSQVSIATELSHRLSLKVPSSLSEEEIQLYTRAQLQDYILSKLVTEHTIEQTIRFLNLDSETLQALLSLSTQIVFTDTIDNSLQRFADSDFVQYTAYANISSPTDTSNNLRKSLDKKLLLFQISQLEKDKKKILTKLEKSFSHSDSINEKQVKDIANLLILITSLEDEFKNNSGNLNNYNILLDRFEKNPTSIPYPISLNNALAEIYLYNDRAQKALEILDSMGENSNLYSEYLRVITALRRGEIYLAESINEASLSTMKKTDNLYSNFMILRGTIAQLQENTPLMCDSYEEACLYNNCEPYYRVFEICKQK